MWRKFGRFFPPCKYISPLKISETPHIYLIDEAYLCTFVLGARSLTQKVFILESIFGGEISFDILQYDIFEIPNLKEKYFAFQKLTLLNNFQQYLGIFFYFHRIFIKMLVVFKPRKYLIINLNR